MEFRKWNVLSFLNSPTDPCLSFGSTSLDIDPDLTILCGLGLLLLFLCYLVGFPSLPAFCKTKDIRKRQGRAKRRRKGGTSKGKVLPIPPDLSKGDPSCPFHEVPCP
ncbi:Spermatogenesis-associated protein 31D1 [Camelus dromedarius]|uniref:Spermatogenesis-associated protein 31D1 n=1 Tax=Camelus dromedarius TaxID=9838 RepID=A0A5N4E903_CAMDR|nr:Spermatogenesis-associated protein 31D1 [Camelus dromedarius]